MPKHKPAKLQCTEAAFLPTTSGKWQAIAFRRAGERGDSHLALIASGPAGVRGAENVLVRVQSECVTGEVFGSRKCDCGEQLRLAMRAIQKKGTGIIIYLRQEGRGIGLFSKIRAYHLQDHGYDTVEANRKLGLPDDAREYGIAAQMLKSLGVASVRLLTADLGKVAALKKGGIKVTGRTSLRVKSNKYDREYLKVKLDKLGHCRSAPRNSARRKK